MQLSSFVLALTIGYAAMPVPSAVASGAGELDPDFGGTGIHVGGDVGEIAPVVEVDDLGRVVVAAWGPEGGLVHRFLADGTPDPSFGIDGERAIDFGAPVEIWGMALQDDGRIVVAGTTSTSGADDSDVAIARLTSDGDADPSFRGDGIAALDLGHRERADAVAVTPDGRIVVAGSSYVGGGRDFQAIRFRPTGALDPTFGGDGRVLVGFGGVLDEALDVAVQPDGKVVVVGRTDAGTGTGGAEGYDFAVVRLRSTGALDHAFAGDGRLTTHFGGSDRAAAATLQPDGGLVVAGWTVHPSPDRADFALARYTPSGELDATFSGDGRVRTALSGPYDYAKDVAVQPDGRIVAVGSARVSPVGDGDLALVRYHPNGALDGSFGDDGRVTTHLDSFDSLSSVVLQSDGRLVVSGATGTDYDHRRILVARYLG